MLLPILLSRGAPGALLKNHLFIKQRNLLVSLLHCEKIQRYNNINSIEFPWNRGISSYVTQFADSEIPSMAVQITFPSTEVKFNAFIISNEREWVMRQKFLPTNRLGLYTFRSSEWILRMETVQNGMSVCVVIFFAVILQRLKSICIRRMVVITSWNWESLVYCIFYVDYIQEH